MVDIYEQKNQIGILFGVNKHELELSEIKKTITESFNYENCKPLLFPLEMIIKEIEVNGEKIIPIVEMAKKRS